VELLLSKSFVIFQTSNSFLVVLGKLCVHPACGGMNAEIRSNIFGAADGMNQSMQQTTFVVAPDFRVLHRGARENAAVERPTG